MSKILIVDDEPDNLYMMEVLLQAYGYETDRAVHGEEGLEKARTSRPDLIISDIYMPVMDGFSFLHHCKKEEILKDIPFVFYSGAYTDQKDQDFALSIGVERFIVKPTRPEDFLAIVKEVLAKYQELPTDAPAPPPPSDGAFFQGYSETLVRKLEEKVRDLEATNMALQESRQKYYRLFEDAVLGIFQSLPSGRYVTVNQAFARMYGFDSPQQMIDEVVDVPSQLFDLPQDMDRMMKLLSTEGVAKGFIAPFKRRDGKKGWIAVNALAVKDAQGNIASYEVTAEDITEKFEGKILESSILDSIPQAVLGLENRIITFANADTFNIFGWHPEELIGRSTRVFYRTDEEFEKIGTQVYHALKTQRTFRRELEYPCRRRDGRDILCRVKAARIGESLLQNRIVATYEDITEEVRTKEQLRQAYKQLQQALTGAIRAISTIVETKDPYTAGHQEGVQRLAVAIAEKMNLTEQQITAVSNAALLHDVGKIYIPSEILSKPGKLSDVEFSLIKSHPEVGYQIIKDIDFSYPVADIVHQHHERLDGSGYPQGLRGDAILREARIIAVADVVDTMASHRPYRPAIGMEKAIEEITRNRGILYDAEVVDVCLDILRKRNLPVN